MKLVYEADIISRLNELIAYKEIGKTIKYLGLTFAEIEDYHYYLNMECDNYNHYKSKETLSYKGYKIVQISNTD